MHNNNLDERPYFLIPSVLVIEGATRILLCDTERSENFLVPLKYKTLLDNTAGLSLKEAKNIYGYSGDEFELIIQFLITHDLVYFSNMPDYYVPLQTSFDYPTEITNAIIDIGLSTSFSPQVAMQLQEINCFHLQIRYMRAVDMDEIKRLLEMLNNMFVKSVELAIPWGLDLTEDGLTAAVSGFVFIDAIICYGFEEEREFNGDQFKPRVLYFTRQILSQELCGIVSPSYFTSSVIAFSESKKHNSCLNRKISIDLHGNIKNCPSMNESYGNINDTTLKEAIEKPGFKKYWDINKDKIHVCKDCEFRYICTDCRAYIEDPEDIYSKPLKCGYNPYRGEWSEWSTNSLKQKAIEFYGMQNIIEEKQKLSS